MSPNKTLYIRDADTEIWERAEAIAQARNTSVSQLATDGLRATLPPTNPADDPDMEEIRVDVGDEGQTHEEGFIGRWLVAPDRDDTRTGEEGYDAGAYWGVALTKRGRFAVYKAHCNDRFAPALTSYDSLDEAEADGHPADILAQAAAVLGQDRVIWRDI